MTFSNLKSSTRTLLPVMEELERCPPMVDEEPSDVNAGAEGGEDAASVSCGDPESFERPESSLSEAAPSWADAGRFRAFPVTGPGSVLAWSVMNATNSGTLKASCPGEQTTACSQVDRAACRLARNCVPKLPSIRLHIVEEEGGSVPSPVHACTIHVQCRRAAKQKYVPRQCTTAQKACFLHILPHRPPDQATGDLGLEGRALKPARSLSDSRQPANSHIGHAPRRERRQLKVKRHKGIMQLPEVPVAPAQRSRGRRLAVVNGSRL